VRLSMTKVNNELEGYMLLCDAIVCSGYAEHDTSFIESEWCHVLKSIVIEYVSCSRSINTDFFSRTANAIKIKTSK
jgi:hypothetical protein